MNWSAPNCAAGATTRCAGSSPPSATRISRHISRSCRIRSSTTACLWQKRNVRNRKSNERSGTMSTLNPAGHLVTTHEHEAHAHAAHHEIGFVRKYVFSTDHKIIGIQFLFTTLLMFLVGGT